MLVDTKTLIDAVVSRNSGMLETYDPDVVIRLFDGVDKASRYAFVPAAVDDMWAAIRHKHGAAGFADFQTITMLRLIEDFEARSAGKKYSDAIRKRFSLSFKRIIDTIKDEGTTLYSERNDFLLKEIGICRQQIFPAGGARIAHPWAALAKSLLFRGGVGQAFRGAASILRYGGFSPYYDLHTHMAEIHEFNEEGYVELMLNLAGMLRLNTHVKGVCFGSWLYDPTLETVSPRLAYLRRLPIDNGATSYYIRVDDIHGGALIKSETRRMLYETGRYVPKVHRIVWSRRKLLAWADQQEAGV